MIELLQYCTICNHPMEWVDCPDCEDGFIDLHDEDPLWYDEDETEVCETCMGYSGWQVCTNYKNHPASSTASEGEGI